MIGIILGAPLASSPAVGGLTYRRARQRGCQALVIDTLNGIVEEQFIRIGEIHQ
jgi:hypothetical protein